ncbi:hypothetical protein Q5P01_017721 [Channa striata]|uniref:Uncharacterized protein n=1 Tax=Channa striata TaxID=64152 RepID=A0AA88MDM2_CHASR|nr:hypothetical protein Q5P01_017721 [Channa striata]
MEGIAFVIYGMLLRHKESGGHELPFVWILIAQGALLVVMGTCGICCVCRQSQRSGLKAVCVILAFLALADVTIAMVVFFSCKKSCPTFMPEPSHFGREVTIALFLGTAVLLIFAVICSIFLLRQKQRLNVEFSARFTATS